ncbi:MAG: ABC-type transport auxiliary lipoprotein family protein [Paracoccus sp. (in: a-proteobacteria)]|nr:ABC-type transport auxiliary lipoprotein family protein [Paracoccus sp. (in: a-proteobacteria)]
MSRHTLALAIAAMLTLPGCAAISALSGEPVRDVFELRPPVDTPRTCGQGSRIELVVEPPKVSGSLDSDRIMVRPNVLQAEYLGDSRWADPLPEMVRTLLVRSLGAYDIFRYVGRDPLGMSGDVALLTEITRFNAAISPDEAVTVELQVNAQLVEEMTTNIVARRQFNVVVPVEEADTRELMPAFDRATLQLLTQMSDWTISAVGGNPAACR